MMTLLIVACLTAPGAVVPRPMPGRIDVWNTVLNLPSNLLSRRSARIAGQAVVITALVGGTAAYANADTTVQLTVDGETEEVSAFGNTVADVLEAADVEVTDRDVVAPAVDERISDGATVVVRHARPLTLTVDGDEETHWTTAQTVGDALRDLDVRASGARVSASRSLELGRDGLEVEVTTPQTVQIHIDGTVQPHVTLQQTVGDVLVEAGAGVNRDDKINVPSKTPVTEGMDIVVTRMETSQLVTTKAIPFGTEERKSGDLYEGERKVTQAGKVGQRTLTWDRVTADGVEVSVTKTGDRVTANPTTQVVLVGTKERPAAAPAPARASRSAERTSSGSSTPSTPARSAPSGSVWDRLAQCESGGNWSINTGNGYYGGVQFSLQTWRAMGGQGYPHENSREQQIAIASKLQAKAGWGQWPSCSRKLGLR